MAGHSRPKDCVASLAYVPAIHVLLDAKKTWMPGTRPGMTGVCAYRYLAPQRSAHAEVQR
jgi:hypothetical protein